MSLSKVAGEDGAGSSLSSSFRSDNPKPGKPYAIPKKKASTIDLHLEAKTKEMRTQILQRETFERDI